MQSNPPNPVTGPTASPSDVPRGVQIYDRPASADRARKLMPFAIGVAVLVSVGLSALVTSWIW